MVPVHMPHEGRGPEESTARVFDADTVTWVAGGETQWCACDECWRELPFWRYVAMIHDQWRREHPKGSRMDLANHVWSLLSATRTRLTLWRITQPQRARLVRALRSRAERDGFNLGELYEIVMRGLAHRGEVQI